jgi:hypothetical protein
VYAEESARFIEGSTEVSVDVGSEWKDIHGGWRWMYQMNPKVCACSPRAFGINPFTVGFILKKTSSTKHSSKY